MQVSQLNESAEHVELKMNYLDGDSIQPSVSSRARSVGTARQRHSLLMRKVAIEW